MHWVDFSFSGLIRILALVALAWVCIYFYQDRLLHYPEPIAREQALVEAARLRLTPWPDSQYPRAWLRSTRTTTRGTIVLFHGNGGHALHRVWFADEMERLGMRTLLAEHPGYGHRTGGHAERILVGDARETIAQAKRAFPGPLVAAGESLGAAVAAGTQADPASAVDGILLITPWLTLPDVAAFHYPWFPVSLVLRDRYDSALALSAYSGRQVIMLAGRDSLIPPEQAWRLFEGLHEPKRLIEVLTAGHNDWVDYVSSSGWREIIDFLIESPGPGERR
jgi:hypothetical protein